jgi:hypothetical protein
MVTTSHANCKELNSLFERDWCGLGYSVIERNWLERATPARICMNGINIFMQGKGTGEQDKDEGNGEWG